MIIELYVSGRDLPLTSFRGGQMLPLDLSHVLSRWKFSTWSLFNLEKAML